MSTGLFLFTSDLRVQDNLALFEAARHHKHLVLAYVNDDADRIAGSLQAKPLGQHRNEFIQQGLVNLAVELEEMGQYLVVTHGKLGTQVRNLVRQYQVDTIYYSRASDSRGQQRLSLLAQQIPEAVFKGVWQHTLYAAHQLPFEVSDIPTSFSKFRRKLEQALPSVFTPQQLVSLPPPPNELVKAGITLKDNTSTSESFEGGAGAGNRHLAAYFDSDCPKTYKETRNALDEWQSSTKFSPWLAAGCLSPRQVYHALKSFEQARGENDSTYWIFFELLWREYFHWYAFNIGEKLFEFTGVSGRKPLTTFHAERLIKWQQGTTPYPLVNAIMHQLNATGYISNRARQIAASALVNELSIDWRYGAAYFQQELIDYDTAINWGNWQYIAGVGADPRGGRHFNLDKQQQMFDAGGEYVSRWFGEHEAGVLDSTDMVDWPSVN